MNFIKVYCWFEIKRFIQKPRLKLYFEWKSNYYENGFFLGKLDASNMLRILTSLLILLIINSVNSLKILGLFSHPGESHFYFFHPIMRDLAEAGHDVTVVSHFPDPNPLPNYIDLKLPETGTSTNSVHLEVNHDQAI